MNRDDVRALEALALAGLPEKAMIARLASTKYTHATPSKRCSDISQAKAIILSTFPARNNINRLVKAFHEECVRQEKIHNERKAIRDALKNMSQPYTRRLIIMLVDGDITINRRRERIRHAQLMFGDFIKTVFSSDILALMELTAQDCRSYRVEWLDVGLRPAISAVVRVTVTGNNGSFVENFLLYKVPGTSKARTVTADYEETVKGAWSYQVPPAAIAVAKLPGVRSKRTDFETQEIVIVDADGDEQRFPWRGKAEDV